MKGKIVWLILSCLMVLSLVLASCAAAVEEEEEVVEEEVVEEEVVEEEVVEEEVVEEEVVEGEPIYGGVLTVLGSDPRGYDPAITDPAYAWVNTMSCNKLITGNWWKGPAGTNEWHWDMELFAPEQYLKGDLAESWERPDAQTVIYYLRQGVYWQDKPGVMAAREFTADDVVWNYERFNVSPTHYLYAHVAKPDSITALDRYTVEFKLPIPYTRMQLEILGNFWVLIPPEVVEEYGDMSAWANVCGTGPYLFVDFVAGSSLTWERNPNYWEKDLEGRSLPYLDGVHALIIPDASTRLAALQTGKIAKSTVDWETAGTLDMTTTELLKYRDLVSSALRLILTCEGPPFGPTLDPNALLVRRAANMAIDRFAVAEEYYGGNAVVITSIIPPQFTEVYFAPEELPESQRQLFEYNPEEARRLLTLAGYPNGIDIELHTTSGGADYCSMIKAYFDAVGIRTTIKTRESAAHYALQFGHKMTGVLRAGYSHRYVGWMPAYETNEEGEFGFVNWGQVYDPYFNEKVKGIFAESDNTKMVELIRELNLYTIDQAYDVVMPSAARYYYWWPWLKGYHGEGSVGNYSWWTYLRYVWIDPELKEAMGH